MTAHQPRHASAFRSAALAKLPCPQLLAWLVAAALGQWVAAPARADSGTGVDTVLGNAMNPAGVDTTRARDPDGKGETAHSRSPTGLLNAEPWALRPPTTAAGWLLRGQVEAGLLSVSGDRTAARFGEYKSLKNGLYLNNFQLGAEKPDASLYIDVLGGGLGRDDAYLGVTAGRYNSWRLKTHYNETEHLFTSTYRNLWSGTGTPRLTLNNLPAGPLAPATAASTDIAIGAAALATPYSNLSVSRRKGGLRLDLTLPADWTLFAAFGSEQRKGARPFGLVSAGGGGTGGVEIPETIDYDTHDVALGLQWASARTSLNLQASASMFRNNAGTMTVDNPMFLAAANGVARFPQAVYDLYPDNDFFNLKAELAHSMPELWRARFTGVLSASSSRQNDALIPPTPYTGLTVNGIAGGAWDTTASLSKTHSGAQIDSRLADLGMSLNPDNALQLKGKWRHYATTNDTEYWACNPLTGQWGRVTNDGSAAVFAVPNAAAGNNPAGTPATAYAVAQCNMAAVQALKLTPSAGNVNIRNVPYDHTQDNLSLAADWQVARGQNLSLALERERIDRSHRERATTDEDRIKLGYVLRSLEQGSLRVSLEQARRRGSTYVSDPYDEFYSASMGPMPTATGTNMTSWIHVNDLHRKFDLADRDQSTLNLRFNHALRPDLDLALHAQVKRQDYPGVAYGRNGSQRQNSMGLDINWQPSPETQLYGYASQQDSRLTQTGLQQNACVLGSTYYLYSDGSMGTTATPTPAQLAAGITAVGNSGAVTAANFLAVCATASATSPLYPTSRSWTATQTDRSVSAGLGARHDFGKLRAEANYNLSWGRTGVAYTYNPAALGLATSGAATPAQNTALALIGNGLSDLVVRTDTLDASVVVPFTKSLAMRVLLRHERGRIKDWHYDGVAANPTPAANMQTYLDAGPQDYKVTVLGVMLQLGW